MTERIVALGAIDRLGAYLAPLGARRVLVLVSSRRRYVDRAVAAMPGFATGVYDGAAVHVPRNVVDSALTAVEALSADTVLALGGGAAIGLGKALCLSRDLLLVAVPTTYSGSEMTAIYGITDDNCKQTGRDERVRPALVIYDASLSADLPLPLTLQSLANSMAQIVSALSTNSVADPQRTVPLVGELWQLMQQLSEAPVDLALRERALLASAAAGRVVDAGTMGWQHRLAHRLGGRFALEHAEVHSIVLPAFMAWLREHRPDLMAALDGVAGVPELETALSSRLRAIGAPLSIRELGVSEDAFAKLVDDCDDLPADLLWRVY